MRRHHRSFRETVWAGAALVAVLALPIVAGCGGGVAAGGTTGGRPGSGGTTTGGSGGEGGTQSGGIPTTGGAQAEGGVTSGGVGTGGAATGGVTVTGGAATGGTTARGGAGGGTTSAGGGTTGRAGAGGATMAGGAGTGGAAVTGGAPGTGGQPGTGGATSSGGSTSNPWITFDPAGIVSRSSIVLTKPNSAGNQLMPLGNGTLGAAVWAANGFTAQLNRADTMPDRKSPGQLTIPGLAKLTGASDFRGTLNLYDGMLVESGGGMTAKIYIRADSDELVVDVTGADPASSQTASVTLWTSRNPTAATSGAIATLSESWSDTGTWGSNQKWGSLAALTASGQGVTASASGRTITVAFKPNADGSFRVVCGAPKWNGSIAAATAASQLLGDHATAAGLEKTHFDWWHAFWGRVGLMKLSTSDGSGEYLENIRAVFLYAHAAESRGERPGSQAGIADFFNFTQDTIDWYAAGYWFWNLRMQVAASVSSGAFELNAPLFNLYTSNIANMQSWTKQRMGGRPGICLPETMRFNGNGWWYDGNHSCDEASSPSYNALTLSSGAEVSLWVWRTYLFTQDKEFLTKNFPLMLEAARFLHAYAKTGSDGKLQMSPSNAHENQWAVTNPISDVAAMRAFYPAVIAAAQVIGSTDPLIADLQADIPKLPDLPRTNTARSQVTTPASDSTNIFAYSGQPTATVHNVENDDLEPVWPYDLVSDTDASLFALAKRTYNARAFKDNLDWSFDALHAARLGLASEVPARLQANIGKYQVYPCGLAAWDPAKLNAPYIEQAGVTAAAMNEAVATDFDGVLRLAPAVSTTWGISGTVFVRGKSKVHVHFQNGALVFGVLESGSTGTVKVKNPWGTTQAAIVDSVSGQPVAASGDPMSFEAQAGHAYLIRKGSDANPSPVNVTGIPASAPKKMGSRTLGI